MIFRPELVKLINQRKKTMTRREVTSATCRYRVGHAYQVQAGRGKPGLFPITITAVRQESLGLIDHKDARREGFVTTQEFATYWTTLYGRFDVDLPVWVISFLVGDVADRPHLLAAHCGAPHGDYVTEPRLAMAGEPEAIDGKTADRLAKQAYEQHKLRRLVPANGSLSRIDAELVALRAELGPNGRLDRGTYRDLQRLERARDALQRRLAS